MRTETLAAGVALQINEVGRFFRLLETEALEPVTVTYYRKGQKIAEAVGMLAPYGEKFSMSEGFDRVDVLSASAQVIKFAIRTESEIFYDRDEGNVTVTNVNGTVQHNNATVTNVSQTIRAANPVRRCLIVQNNDATGDIYVRTDGSAATLLTGIKIKAGGTYEFPNFVPTGAVTMIGSIATNPNVVVVEG